MFRRPAAGRGAAPSLACERELPRQTSRAVLTVHSRERLSNIRGLFASPSKRALFTRALRLAPGTPEEKTSGAQTRAGDDGKSAIKPVLPAGSGETVPRLEKAGRGGFMRRFLTLVCLLCLAIPAGISISGCTRNPAANYCNGAGYGMKITEVATITLQPATTGISMAFGQTRQLGSPSALTCKGTAASVSAYTYGTTNNQLVDISPSGQYLRGHVEPEHGRRHPQLHHLQPAQSLALDRRTALCLGLRHCLRPVSDLQSRRGLRALRGDFGQPCRAADMLSFQAQQATLGRPGLLRKQQQPAGAIVRASRRLAMPLRGQQATRAATTPACIMPAPVDCRLA